MSQSDPTPALQNMSEATIHIEGRVASLERGLSDLALNLSNFVTAQRDENKLQREEISKVYGAMKEINVALSGGLEAVKVSVGERGKITGSFVLMLIATGVSLIAIIGGFVNSYVSTRVDMVRLSQEQVRSEVTQYKIDADRARDTLMIRINDSEKRASDEVNRASVADARGDTQRQALMERVATIEHNAYMETQEELHTLRSKTQSTTPGTSK